MKRTFTALAAAATVALTAATATAQEKIKVGVLTPNTGPFAAIGEDVRNGFRLYFDEIGNKAAGKDIEVIFEDTQAKPDVGLTKTKKLVESDGVSFVSGIVSSAVAYAVRDYIVEKGVPLIVSVASADGLTQQLAAPNIFRTNGSGSQSSHPMGKWLFENGYKRVALMAPGYAMGFEQTGGIARTFTEAGGKVIQATYPPLGAPDFAPFLSSLKTKEIDALVAVFAGSDAIKFVKQYDEYGLKGSLPLVGTSLLTDDMILAQQGDSAIGTITASHYSSAIESPVNAKFVEAYQARFKRPPNLYSEGAYVAAKVMHMAVEQLKGNLTDKAAVNKALASATFDAPRGKFRFDSYNSPIHDIYVFKVERRNGALVNAPFSKIPDVSQFFTWDAKAFMAMPPYRDISETWVK